MTWRVARSLPVLHQQLQAASRAAPPATPASAWGTIGDAAHSSTSDHAPKDFTGWGVDIVTAADFPDVPALGLDAWAVLDSMRRSRDPRIKYCISRGRMFSSYATTAYPAWVWRPYSGSDGHFTHGHVSVVGDARADSAGPWQIGAAVLTTEQAQELANVHKWLHAYVTGQREGAWPHTSTIAPNMALEKLLDLFGGLSARVDALANAVEQLTPSAVVVGAEVADAVVDRLRDRLAD